MVMLLLPWVGESQNYHFRDIVYYSVGIGPNINMCENPSAMKQVGFHGNASMGVNIFPHFGGRVQLTLLHSTNALLNPGYYMIGHVDGTFRLFYKLTERKSSAHEMFLTLGVGAVRRFQNEYGDVSNAFCIVPGIIYNCPITPSTQLSFELKSHLIPTSFDENEKFSALNTLSFGIVHHLNGNPRRNGIVDGYYPFHGKWHLSASVGVNSMQYKGIGGISERLKLITPATEILIGKRLSSILSLRVGLSGIQVATKNGKKLFADGHLDGVVNITNIINNDPQRNFNFSIYGGGGLIFDLNSKRPTLQANAGMIAQVRLFKRSEVFADLRYNMVHYNFADYPGQKRFSVGIASLMVGYTYYMGMQ